MIVIMIFHHTHVLPLIPIFRFGFLCVDVFLFLSGFGIYYSLKNHMNGQKPLLLFYKRRLIRIMPAAIIAGIGLKWLPSCRFEMVNDYLNFAGLGLWFIRTLLVLYFVSPIIYKLIEKYKQKIVYGCMILCSVVIMWFINTGYAQSSFLSTTMTSWTLARTPAFVCGMMVPFLMEQDPIFFDKNKKRNIICGFVFMVISLTLLSVYLLNITHPSFKGIFLYMGWLMFVPFLPLACVLMSKMISSAASTIQKTLQWIGGISLELYLCHESVYALTSKFIPSSTVAQTALKSICMLLFSFVCAYALHKICTFIPGISSRKKVVN